ncbi:MAG: hypothetical protein OER98_03335 [Gammaproteobacteria bacterium]|nr:hypothetical protein [Gammaproteobacteria bacterium]
MSAPTLAIADDDELEFDEAYLYFELNDTDGDLGIHGKVDGGPWKKVKIEGPNDRTLLKIRARSKLARQGMTELFFESAEPTFDELHPVDFFNRFPEGEYEWEGLTLEYEEIEGEVYLSHVMPAAPVVTGVGDLLEGDNPGFAIEIEDGEEEVAKQCWEVEADDNGDVVISWRAVTMSHKDMWDVDPQPLLLGEILRYDEDEEPERKFPLGDPGSFTEDDLEYYEFVAEIDDTEYKSTAVIPPGTTSWTVPAEVITLANEEGEGEVKFEIIVRAKSPEVMEDDGDLVKSKPGNQSAVEDCFEIYEEDDE